MNRRDRMVAWVGGGVLLAVALIAVADAVLEHPLLSITVTM